MRQARRFLAQVGTGLRSGELLGLRRRRVFPELRRIEVIEVRYEAGRFGRGFKAEPKSPASVRVVPMCERVRQVIGRQLPAAPDPNMVSRARRQQRHPRGARTPVSPHNLARLPGRVADAARTGPTFTCTAPELRHTFATWLEDAGIPLGDRELMARRREAPRRGQWNSVGRSTGDDADDARSCHASRD